jgi:hypothetical protein
VSRRTVLTALAVGTATLVTGCTGWSGDDAGETAGPPERDPLADQVDAQQALVDAYATAFAASPDLATRAAPLAAQTAEQLTRLQAAAPALPTTAAATTPGAPTTASPPAPLPADALGWLRGQVEVAAASHATACPGLSGPRAALLGSIAAGLRGHTTQLV